MKTSFVNLVTNFIVLCILTVSSMNHAQAAQENEPSGVLYFSNGREIEKLNLKIRKREVVVPKFDGEAFMESINPVFSSMRDKMYFFYSEVVERKNCGVGVYDFATQKIEKKLDFCGHALSLSVNEQWFAYFRGGQFQSTHTKEEPAQLVIRKISDGEEKVVADDVSPYVDRLVWLGSEELIYKNLSRETIQININTKEKRKLVVSEKVSYGPLSPDGRFLLCDDYLAGGRNVYLFDFRKQSLEPIVHFWLPLHFLIQDVNFWAPDGKSFIYTRHDWTNFRSFFAETGHLYWHDLVTGKEIKVAHIAHPWGGFWLAEDPAKNSSNLKPKQKED